MRNSVMAGYFAFSVLGLAAFPSGSAEAAGTYLAVLRAVPVHSNAIEVKSEKSGGSHKVSSPKPGKPPKLSATKSEKAPKFSEKKHKDGPQLALKKHKVDKDHQKKWAKDHPKKQWFAKRVRKGIRWVGGHRYHGAYFIVPFGTALYARNYCYDWFYGPYGWGYYWNYDRCPIPPQWLY